MPRTRSAWARRAYPQPAPPALWQGQGREALLQGLPFDATTTVQQTGRRDMDGAEPDHRNCGMASWTAACRHLARDTRGLRPYRPGDCTAPAPTVAVVTMGPVPAWLARLAPNIPFRGARPRQPAATQAPTAPLTAEKLCAVAAALLADSWESFVHHHGPAQIRGSIQGPQRDATQPVARHAS